MAAKKRTYSDFNSSLGKRSARRNSPYRTKQNPFDQVVFNVPTQQGDFVITRRNLLLGTAGIVAVAGVGIGSSLISKKLTGDSDVEVLSVPEASVTSMAEFEQVDSSNYMYVTGEYELPYGTLIWASETVAACLIPGETGSPLNKIGVLSLSSGYWSTVLEKAVGADEGFEIFDVRGSSNGLIWTEANILQNMWRVYGAALNNLALGEARLLEEGGSEWETPTLAAVGPYLYWQMLPSLSSSQTDTQSVLKKTKVGFTDASVVYSSTGRMATAPSTTIDGVVITPRANTEGMYYQLTVLKASDDSVLDTMVLPQSMKPLEVGYGVNGFNFSFDAIYNYGDGIANLGTYTPLQKPTSESYSNTPWFALNRAPSAPACWCGNLFMIKSTHVVCGVNMQNQEYFTLDVHGGSLDYGSYLASTGENTQIVTYANIDDNPIDGDRMYCTLVTVYKST